MISPSDILHGKILVVDDRAANVLLLEQTLRGAGYLSVTSTTRPEEVRGLYLKNRYDLILLDLEMPVMDGFEVMEGLKEVETDGYLPVLVITADPAHKLRALNAGAKDFVSKPLNLPEVLIRVCNMLEVRLLHRETKKLYDRAVADREALQGQTALLDLASDAILAHDLEGRISFWNSGAERIYGWKREEAAGRIKHELLRSVFPEPLADIRSKAIRSGGWEGEITHTRRNGGTVAVFSRWVLQRDASGGPAGFLEINTDLTGRKKEEEERRKTKDLEGENRRIMEGSRLKSEFLANMSHELRTPLNGIIGFSELLHDGKVGTIDAVQKEYLGDILNSARHLLQLINDVLDLSKVESGKMEFHFQTVLLEKVIGEVCDVLRTLVAQKRISLETAVHPGVARVVGDPAKLKQILYNYLSNALKFTPEEGKVRLRALPEGPDDFRIEVEDTGVGIKPEDQHRLFVEFQQLDSTMAKKHAGTGLGLALTKRIVEAQGGQVGLKSSLGKGSVFFAVLPKAPPAAAAEAVAGRSDPQSILDAATVLVVDDNDPDRVWLIHKLTAAGYSVEAVADGEQAISRCKARRFGAVLLDLILPDMNGWEVLNAIRGSDLNRATPVIVVTVVSDKDAGIIHPIQDYLLKPVSLDVLKRALEGAGIFPKRSLGPVLVVDDDPKALKIMREHLDGLGYRSILAAGGAEALKAAKLEAPAAVILDLIMPEMDGFQFLEKFRENAEGGRTPVIIWTGKDLSHEEASRLKLTTQALLRKEGSSQELIEQLRKILPPSAALAGVPGKIKKTIDSHGG